jgi:putative membrane protein
MRTLPRLFALLVLPGCIASAWAQAGNPAGMKPGTPEVAPGKPKPDEHNIQDRLFARLLAAGGQAEVQAGRLAARRGSAGVKSFGDRMVHDHTQAGEQLAALARQSGIPLPSGPDPDQQAMLRELESAPAERFDAVYLRGQLIDHQKTVQLLEWEIDSGQDANLQRFASETLPTVLDHLRHAQQQWSVATGAPPQGLALAGPAH